MISYLVSLSRKIIIKMSKKGQLRFDGLTVRLEKLFGYGDRLSIVTGLETLNINEIFSH